MSVQIDHTNAPGPQCEDCGAVLPYHLMTGLYSVTMPFCPVCAEVRAGEAFELAVAAKTAAWKRQRETWAERQSRLPAAVLGTKLLDNFDAGRSAAARMGHKTAERWLTRFFVSPLQDCPWLVVHGQSNGTGKTHLLFGLLQAVMDLYVPSEWELRQTERAQRTAPPEAYQCIMQEQRRRAGCPVLYYDAWELLLAVAEARRPKRFEEPPAETEHALLQRLITVPVLGIDDWGRGRSRRDIEEQHLIWFMIVDGRDKRGLPIIATSNVPLEGLEPVIGKAAADRLFGRTMFVPMEGASERVFGHD